MKKFILSAVLFSLATGAVAGGTDEIKAGFEFRSSIEKMLIVNDNLNKDTWLISQQITKKIQENITSVIVDGLKSNVSCEEITAYVTEGTRERYFQPSVTSPVGLKAAEQALSSQAVWTMARCYSLKG